MDLVREPFYMVSDKELTLQSLHLNNVPAIELIDPKNCKFPIIGRKYGNYRGKDISIIHTLEQAIDEGHDYYTDIYAFEEEYYMEVEGLTVKSVQKAIGKEVIFNEVPIRTEAYGWKWEKVETDKLHPDWQSIGIRALYVTGVTKGYVKIGVLPNETIKVVDIHASDSPYSEPDIQTKIPFSIGADIEFMLSCDDELLPASTFFPFEGSIGCDERQIERDSGAFALAELRPEQADSPHELYNNIKELLFKASKMVPYENIQFRAGSMPFLGYQCGGHIHFGINHTLSLLRALDYYLAVPLAMIEEPKTARLRRRTNHGGLGRFRVKPYGFEYLTLSSWILDPQLALSILCLARLIAIHHKELNSDLLFHPLIQRAYYHGNQMILKQFWKKLKSRIMETSNYSLFKSELNVLFDAIEKGSTFSESSDIRRNWGAIIENQVYVPGLIIQIPKKTRLKFNLKEGQKTYVRSGNEITQATIHPYPFSFRNPNMVQLSKSLREKLSLPEGWCPKLTSANGVLTLGPIMGILANRPFDRQTTYFQHLGRLAKEKQMLVYIFEPQDIDWEQKLIKGTTLEGDGIFPFPAVIYDRYFLFRDKKIDIDRIRAKLQSLYNIPFINPVDLFYLTGNKWDCHQLLVNDYKEFLPESRLLEHSSNITEMLNQYGEVFLKPLGGALSMGVVRVIRRPTGIYCMNLNKKTFQQLQNIDELFSLLSPLLEETPYLIQEGIRRKQFNGKNVEIRVYMQKNGNQKWLRTGMVTRLTGEDVLTENTEQNMRLSILLKKLYDDQSERRKISNQLAKIAKDIVLNVEGKIGNFGELAVDFCLDQYDSIKLLEINAKPDNLFSQIKAYKLRNLAGVRLLNYAVSLAGYESEEK